MRRVCLSLKTNCWAQVGTIPKVVRNSKAKNRHEGGFVNKVRGNALISLPADVSKVAENERVIPEGDSWK